MEPITDQIRIPDVLVVDCKQHFYKKHVKGSGEHATFIEVSLGWYLTLEGSYEALYVGKEQPRISSGDRVSVIIRRQHAIPIKTSV